MYCMLWIRLSDWIFSFRHEYYAVPYRYDATMQLIQWIMTSNITYCRDFGGKGLVYSTDLYAQMLRPMLYA